MPFRAQASSASTREGEPSDLAEALNTAARASLGSPSGAVDAGGDSVAAVDEEDDSTTDVGSSHRRPCNSSRWPGATAHHCVLIAL